MNSPTGDSSFDSPESNRGRQSTKDVRRAGDPTPPLDKVHTPESLIFNSLGVAPYRWQDLNKKLAALVTETLEQSDITLQELAERLGISSETLTDYLDPNSHSVIGSYFLGAKNILGITDDALFPTLEEEERVEANRALVEELTNIEIYTVVRYLTCHPEETFGHAIGRRIAQIIEEVCEEDSILLFEADRCWGYTDKEFSISELHEAADSGDWEEFLENNEGHFVMEMLQLVDSHLKRPLSDILPLRAIPDAEVQELENRIHLHHRIKGIGYDDFYEAPLTREESTKLATDEVALSLFNYLAEIIRGEYNWATLPRTKGKG